MILNEAKLSKTEFWKLNHCSAILNSCSAKLATAELVNHCSAKLHHGSAKLDNCSAKLCHCLAKINFNPAKLTISASQHWCSVDWVTFHNGCSLFSFLFIYRQNAFQLEKVRQWWTITVEVEKVISLTHLPVRICPNYRAYCALRCPA